MTQVTEAKVTDIKVVEKKTNNMVKAIESVDIKDGNALEEIKQHIKTAKAWIEQEKEKYIAPAKEIIAKAKEQYDPLMVQVEEAERSLKGRIQEYVLAEQKKEEEQKEKLAKRVEKGTMKAETAVRKMEEMPEQKKTHGGVTVKKVKDYRIVDESKIPQEYYNKPTINKSLLRKNALTEGMGFEVKDGKIISKIAGIEVYEKSQASF